MSVSLYSVSRTVSNWILDFDQSGLSSIHSARTTRSGRTGQKSEFRVQGSNSCFMSLIDLLSVLRTRGYGCRGNFPGLSTDNDFTNEKSESPIYLLK
jgi:hypothetical protein